MTASITKDVRQSRATRRVGYVVSIIVNGAILYAANQWPGWDALPFLTEETPQVLGIINASLVAGIVANIVYLAWDPPRLRALGDVVTLAIGLAATVQVWQVFPFDFSGSSWPWETIARVLLVLAIFGSAVGILVALVNVVRGSPRRA